MKYSTHFSKPDVILKDALKNGYIEGIGDDLENLARKIKKSYYSVEELKQVMSNIKGSFNFCLKVDENNIFFAVDHIRSRPIYYAKNKKVIYIGDKPTEIWNEIGNIKIDRQNKIEFMLTSYVTGNDTLINSINQLQAGEFAKMNLQTGEIIIFNYSSAYQRNKIEIDVAGAISRIDCLLSKSIERLIEKNKGRTFVLPLSGGYDSRVIAYLLKKHNCKNVIAYSYGNKNNKDKKIGQDLAKKLGYKWLEINYNKNLWRRLSKTGDFLNYIYFANGLTSVPHFQDWPAVKQMKEERLIPDNSIFLPGHTPTLSYKDYSGEFNIEGVADLILDKHYSLQYWRKFKNEKKGLLKEKVMTQLEHIDKNCTYPEDLFSTWEVMERQSKFICNSIKAFEYYGYEWELPLWDKDFYNFWNKLHPKHKKEKLLMKKYVEKLEKDVLGQSKTSIEKTKKYNIRKKVSRNSWKYILLRRVFNFKFIFNDTIGWSYTFGIHYLLYRTTFTDYSSYHSFFTEKTMETLIELEKREEK